MTPAGTKLDWNVPLEEGSTNLQIEQEAGSVRWLNEPPIILAEESTDLLRFIIFSPYVGLALFPTKDKSCL
jgi:hypothetical protein